MQKPHKLTDNDYKLQPQKCVKWNISNAMHYVIVKSQYKCDIIFITWSQGGAEAESNENDM